MKSLNTCVLALLGAAVCFGQQWEIGASGGIGVHTNSSLTSENGKADVGFKVGPAFSGFVTQTMYQHLSGQIRYTFQFDDLKVASGGKEATFKGQSHSIHYDLLFLAGSPESVVRPYVLGGAGVKIYRGTGKEQESQELGQFAALTHTQQAKPLVTFGGGFKAKVGARGFVYVEVRDYLTPFPSNVIAPMPPAKVSGWIHDFVPMIGLSFAF